jgi:hypothetical protein
VIVFLTGWGEVIRVHSPSDGFVSLLVRVKLAYRVCGVLGVLCGACFGFSLAGLGLDV